MALGIIGPWQILIVVGALGIIFPIVALVDILKSHFKGNDKIIWVLVVIFFNFFGSIIYFLMGRKQRIGS